MLHILLIPAFAMDATEEDNIEYLLNQIGQSDCVFVRNGDEHEASEAADHLRMKLRRGKKYVDNADDFIERIASQSTWSGEPYLIRCSDTDEQLTSSWLQYMLETYRE